MLEARGLTVRYGAVAALDGFGLTVPDARVVSVLGPSGCGKSTLLRVIAGLEPVEAGDVLWDGGSLSHVPPHRRGFGLMFQDYSLFPHLTVADNVAFGLRMAHLKGERLRVGVAEALDRVGLRGYERRSIGNLSGGEQQRVALARALAPAPRLLMLDEPLGALDRTLRERLVGELSGLFSELGLTAVYVTHDQEEAFSLADRVVIMRAGRVAQEGVPEEVWARPADEWVARFLGFANIVDAVVTDGYAQTAWGRFPVEAAAEAPGRARRDGPARLLLRTEALVPTADGALQGLVVSRVFRGGRYRVEIQVSPDVVLQMELGAEVTPGAGERVAFAVDPAGVVVF